MLSRSNGEEVGYCKLVDYSSQMIDSSFPATRWRVLGCFGCAVCAGIDDYFVVDGIWHLISQTKFKMVLSLDHKTFDDCCRQDFAVRARVSTDDDDDGDIQLLQMLLRRECRRERKLDRTRSSRLA